MGGRLSSSNSDHLPCANFSFRSGQRLFHQTVMDLLIIPRFASGVSGSDRGIRHIHYFVFLVAQRSCDIGPQGE
jgi:hypothetical protein